MPRSSKSDRASGAAATKHALITVAEDLYGRHGLDGVSLRQIGSAAGCRNTRAVQYHFGNQAGLIDAIFRARLAPIERERERLLMQATALGQEPTCRMLLEVIMRPVAEQRGKGGRRSYAAFLGSLTRSGDLTLWRKYEEELPISTQVAKMLADRLGIDDREFTFRQTAVAIMIWGGLTWGDQRAASAELLDEEFRSLLDMAAAALQFSTAGIAPD